jgi:hypothetical protein
MTRRRRPIAPPKSSRVCCQRHEHDSDRPMGRAGPCRRPNRDLHHPLLKVEQHRNIAVLELEVLGSRVPRRSRRRRHDGEHIVQRHAGMDFSLDTPLAIPVLPCPPVKATKRPSDEQDVEQRGRQPLPYACAAVMCGRKYGGVSLLRFFVHSRGNINLRRRCRGNCWLRQWSHSRSSGPGAAWRVVGRFKQDLLEDQLLIKPPTRHVTAVHEDSRDAVQTGPHAVPELRKLLSRLNIV